MNFLDRLALGWGWLKTWPEEQRRWRNLRPVWDGPRLYYGFDHLPSRDQRVFGGLVKLQDLQTRFPNDNRSPNIIYLVSSALPPFAVRMAKHAKSRGMKIVINQNGVAYHGWYGHGWQHVNAPMKKLHELADFVIYQSKFCKETADRFLGAICPNFAIALNPVDTTKFTPAAAEREQHAGYKLLLAGSHGSFYRPQIAIDTLKLVRQHRDDISLIIAGRFTWGNSPEQALQEVLGYAKKLELDEFVQFVGPYTQNQAITLFTGADILIHTKYNDPCPRLVAEALSCGMPVLYSATGGVPELVGDKAGYGIPGPLDYNRDHPPEPEELVRGVLRILEDLGSYRKRARSRAVEMLDVTPWLDLHTTIFENLAR